MVKKFYDLLLNYQGSVCKTRAKQGITGDIFFQFIF